MKPALVIMAAGMGSRYGGLKQIDTVGPGGERIIDYSLYDAVQSGFGKIVFIIRREIESEFRAAIEPSIRGRIPVEYVYQDLQKVPPGFRVPENRTKPWGTGHAILCCRDTLHEPFGVINADDFYGRDACARLAEGLRARDPNDTRYVLIGYTLANTLSPHGSVSRGICEVGEGGWLRDIKEKAKIFCDKDRIWYEENGTNVPLPPDAHVSMNMWGFTPSVFQALESGFRDFLDLKGGELTSEFFIPSAVDAMLRGNQASVNVIPTSSRWMGLTYPEDRDAVRSGVAALVEAGVYPSPLW
jgi:hypothetical protein